MHVDGQRVFFVRQAQGFSHSQVLDLGVIVVKVPHALQTVDLRALAGRPTVEQQKKGRKQHLDSESAKENKMRSG